MQKGAILPDEERRFLSDSLKNEQENDEFKALDKGKDEKQEEQLLCYQAI